MLTTLTFIKRHLGLATLLATLAILGACEKQDLDGDGWAADDCDDENAAINPDADEICDKVDNDCDGTTDINVVEGPTFYPDNDDDGFGDENNPTLACHAPEGYVEDGTDCDDSDELVNPEAEERCDPDDVDEDCDETSDDADDDEPLPDGYPDRDGDGWGDGAGEFTSCDDPTAEQLGDCDDTSSGVSPDADELCNGSDDDCDGDIDEDDATDALTWFRDSDGDGFGDPYASTTACNPPSGYVADSTDCNDSNPETLDAPVWWPDVDGDGYGDSELPYVACEGGGDVLSTESGSIADCDDRDSSIKPGAEEVCDGRDTNCDGVIDRDVTGGRVCSSTADTTVEGGAVGDAAGYSVAVADVTGDGRADLIVGAPNKDATRAPDAGAVYVSHGPISSGSWSLDPLHGPLIPGELLGERTDSSAGVALCAADFDEDGVPDLVVGAPGATETGAGAVYIHPGSVAGTSSSLSDSWATVRGFNEYDNAGASVACGSLRNAADTATSPGLVVGATNALSGENGAAYVLTTVPSGTSDIGDVDGDGDPSGASETILWGGAGADDPRTGFAVGTVETAHGAASVLVAASGVGVYLFPTPLPPGKVLFQDVPDRALFVADVSYSGRGLASGDVNNDGHADVVIGDASYDGGAGVVYVVLGNVGGFAGDVILSTVPRLFGSVGGAGLVVAVGDLDGTDGDDLLVGAPEASTAYAILGKPVFGDLSLGSDADYTFEGDDDLAGHSVAIGDVDADGVGDVVVGADAGASGNGAVYVFSGSTL